MFDREGMSGLSIVVPDVGAAITLSALLSQMGGDVRIKPADTNRLWRVCGESNASPAVTRGVVSDWARREEIFCTELVLEQRQLVTA
jgi:hypothetical protein